MINKLRSAALYESVEKGNQQRDFKHWHASSIAMCPRAHYMKRLGLPPINQPTGAKILRWDSGHAIEETIRPHIEQIYGQTKSNERYTSLELDLTGEFDNLTIKDHRLIEIKSVNDLAFIVKDGVTALKEATGEKGPRGGKVWALKQTPYLHHQLQNHCYVLLLAEEGIEVANIDYVYISLGGRIVVYSTKVQQDLLDAVHRRLDELAAAWKAQQPPPCVCQDYNSPLYDSVYQWCDYRNETNGTCCQIEGEQ